MLIFLHGPDTFRSRKKLNELIGSYRKKHKSGLNFFETESSEEGFEEFKKRVETASMFKEKKLLVLENTLSSPKGLQEKIEKYLNEKKLFENKEIILVFFEDKKFKKISRLFNLLSKKSLKKQEFENLPPSKVKGFIRKNYPLKIEEKALDKIIALFGLNLLEIDRELQKLAAYKKGGEIKEKDVDELCRADFDPKIFETIEAVSRKNKKRALELILKHFEKGENEQKILSMFVYQFRTIIKLKSILEESEKEPSKYYWHLKTSGVHPYVAQKTIPIAKSFTIEELKNIYRKLLELDFSIKTGKQDPQIGIEMFVMEL